MELLVVVVDRRFHQLLGNTSVGVGDDGNKNEKSSLKPIVVISASSHGLVGRTRKQPIDQMPHVTIAPRPGGPEGAGIAHASIKVQR